MSDFVSRTWAGVYDLLHMELYHALNRGVDGRALFLDNADHARFVHCLYEFNDEAPASQTFRGMSDLRSRTSTRKKVVDIYGWILVENHYHLLLSERVEGGLTLFLRKLNIGYAKYYNEKYRRSGTLFQGRTKKVRIVHEAHFLYILHYLHLNALDFLKGAEQWRVRDKGGIRNVQAALNHLETYRWSSYQDYIGKKNFPSIITTHFFNKAYGGYAKAIREYLADAELSDSPNLTLE